jgi:outer membrane protein assembly factor BamB
MVKNIGGQARNRIAALDASTGAATVWDPNGDSDVTQLAVSDNLVYAAGEFSRIGGQSRNRVAALDAATGNATVWNPNASSSVNTVAASGDAVYAGGGFMSIGGQVRNHRPAGLAGGLYFYRLEALGRAVSRKMVVIE